MEKNYFQYLHRYYQFLIETVKVKDISSKLKIKWLKINSTVEISSLGLNKTLQVESGQLQNFIA